MTNCMNKQGIIGSDKTESDTSGIIMNKWLINEIDIKCRR